MILILFIIFMLIISCTISAAFIEIYNRVHKADLICHSQIWKLLPLLGAILLMNLYQVLQFFLPAKKSSWFVYVLFILSLWILRKKLKYLPKFIRRTKEYWFLSLISVFAIGLPVILRSELCSIQVINNDIMYYLSTTDWLFNHSLRDPVVFSDAYPYYICADYILKITRFGTDVLSAMTMGMLNLGAHQVFTGMGILYVLLANLSINFMLVEVLKLPKTWGFTLLFLMSVSYCWTDLLALQYVAQIMGIACLIAFISSALYWLFEDNPKYTFLSAIFLAGTAASYAEYCSYMFIIFIGLLVIRLGSYWISEKRVDRNSIVNSFKMAIIAIICNPLGIYVAIKFNLRIFLLVSDSPSNIDASAGNMKSFPAMIARLIGGIDFDKYREVPASVIYGLLLIIIFLIFVFLVLVSFKYIFKSNSAKNLAIFWILFFLLGYGIYFRSVALAYGEYKHLTSSAALITILFTYFLYLFYCHLQHKKLFSYLIAFGTICIITLNIQSSIWEYPISKYFYYDSQLMELQSLKQKLPENIRIGIPSKVWANQHGLVYALKDMPVQLIGEEPNSYFTGLGIPLVQDLSPFIAIKNDDPTLDIPRDEYFVIWENASYTLLYKENKQ